MSTFLLSLSFHSTLLPPTQKQGKYLLEIHLIWFQQLIIYFFVDDFGGSHHEFVSFSSPDMKDYLQLWRRMHEQQNNLYKLYLHVFYQYGDM